jgi:hypothetical protein
MKLAEALQQRADLNRKIEQLKERLMNNALVQDGEKPAEDPAELLKELNSSFQRLNELIALINLKNAATVIDGKTLTEMIAEKDVLKEKIDAYRNLVSQASQTARRARNTEIRILSTVNVKKLQKETDQLSARLRKLDNLIQETNWTTEI